MMRLLRLLGLICILSVPVNVLANGLASSVLVGKKIESIEVKGNRYLEAAAIINEIDSKVGTVFKRRTLSRDIQRLYKTGEYADLKVSGFAQGEGVKLVFHIKENPFITEYKVDGNDEVPYKDLKYRLKLKEGVIFSPAKLKADINTIRKGYIKKGYYQIDVDAEKIILADGSMKLLMHVLEGKKTHVRQIRFVGNDSFSGETLSDKISARVSGFIPWVTNRDVVDNKKFANDAQALAQFYQNHGYLDMNVESAQLSLTPDKKSMYMTFALHEGPVYTVSKVDVQGDMTPSREKLLEAITLKAGDAYSLDELRQSIDAMSLLVGDEGYAFNNVTPLFKRNLSEHTVAITFDIEKGREIYIERIEIEGNDGTDDNVVRREITIDESERFSATKMQHSKEKLTRSALFKDARVSMPKTKTDGHVNAKVIVEEDKTGSFTAGVGFSQLEKLLFRIKTSQKNFLGKGYGVSVTADVGARTQNFDLSFTDPYFMGENVSATFGVRKTQTKLNAIVTSQLYKQNDIGANVNFAIPIAKHLNYNIGYSYLSSKITDVAATASFLLRSQQGHQTTGELTQSLSYDTRDRFAATTKGSIHTFSVGVAGLAGSNRFWEVGLSTKNYFKLNEDYTFRVGLDGGMIHGYSSRSVPIYRRYSLGGVGSLSGFDFYGVSLRDPATSDPLGGDKKVTGTLDLFFPLPYIKTEGLRGVVFTNAGTVWGSEKTSRVNLPFSLNNMRISAGFGVEWLSPFGPMTLSWAKPVKKQSGDLLRAFEFNLGGSF